MKILIKQRIHKLLERLKNKELVMKKDPDLSDTDYPNDTVTTIIQDLVNTESFLDLTTNDLNRKDEIHKTFGEALDRIEERIRNLTEYKA